MSLSASLSGDSAQWPDRTWAVASAGLAGLAFDLVEAVDGAFAALSSGVEGTVARTLKPVHLPLAVEAKVGTVLARPE
mgnify:CR=1 FL=1